MTNLEKWDLKKEYLKSITNEFIEKTIAKSNLKNSLYEISPSGELTKWDVLRFGYNHSYKDTSYRNKIPTKKDIEKLHNYIFNLSFDEDDVIVYCNTKESGVSIQRGHLLKNVLKMIDSEEQANTIAEERKKKYEEYKQFCLDNAKSIYYDFNGNGYTYLGYLNYFEESIAPKEYLNCIEKKHIHIESHSKKNSHVRIFSCPICKIYWSVDSSD